MSSLRPPPWVVRHDIIREASKSKCYFELLVRRFPDFHFWTRPLTIPGFHPEDYVSEDRRESQIRSWTRTLRGHDSTENREIGFLMVSLAKRVSLYSNVQFY